MNNENIVFKENTINNDKIIEIRAEDVNPKMTKEMKEFIDGLVDDWNGVKKKPIVNNSPKVKRNDPCPCNSGKKFKICCLNKD